MVPVIHSLAQEKEAEEMLGNSNSLVEVSMALISKRIEG